MPVAIDEIITAAHYESLRVKVARIYGVPSGTWTTGSIGTTAGYNQTTLALPRVPGDMITAEDWNTLRHGVICSYTHIVGNAPTNPAIPEVTPDICGENQGDQILAKIYNDMETVQNFNTINRNTVAATQKSLSTATVGRLTDTWNGKQTHAFNMIFEDKNHKEGFFNAGGSLRFSTSAAYGGSAAKSIDWATIGNQFGLIEIKNMSIEGSGPGQILIPQGGTFNGWWYINSLALDTPEVIYAITGADIPGYPQYDENYAHIQVTKKSDTRFVFEVIFNDADSGDKTGLGAAVDENVETDITSTVQVFTPSGDCVSLPVPQFTEKTPENTFDYN